MQFLARSVWTQSNRIMSMTFHHRWNLTAVSSVRYFAKKREDRELKRAAGRAHRQEDEDELEEQDIETNADTKHLNTSSVKKVLHYDDFDFKEAQEQMAVPLDDLQNEWQSLYIGRVSPALLENIRIPHQKTTLNQLANITVKNATDLLVQLHSPDDMQQVMSAISGANLGPVQIQVQQEGSQDIAVLFPKMTASYRNLVVQQVTKMADQAKQNLRDVRRHVAKPVAKPQSSIYAKDDAVAIDEQLQRFQDAQMKLIDAAVKSQKQKLQ